MTDIKFCGLTRPADAAFARSLAVRFVGCIFAGGPRHLTPDAAAAVFSARGPAPVPQRVGVVASGDPQTIAGMCRAVDLDVVQLHGDPAPATVAAVREALARAGFRHEIWAVVRCAAGQLPDGFEALWGMADAVLLDAHVPGRLGGTGQTLPWPALGDTIRASRARGSRPGRLVVAGGLTPENVGEAIAALEPDVVDTSSGVESAPGLKDHRRMAAFVQAVADADRSRLSPITSRSTR